MHASSGLPADVKHLSSRTVKPFDPPAQNTFKYYVLKHSIATNASSKQYEDSMKTVRHSNATQLVRKVKVILAIDLTT